MQHPGPGMSDGLADMALLVRIEGVDFAQTIVDTNDLSTQRGAGLAYLAAPRALIEQAARKLKVEPKEIFTGASIGVYRLDTDEAGEEVERMIRALASGRGPGDEAGTEDESVAAREQSGSSPEGAGAGSDAAADAGDPSEGETDGAVSEEDALEIGAEVDDKRLWVRLRPLLPHLNFAVAAEQIGSSVDADQYRAARLRLQARVRKAQLQSPTVVPPAPVWGKWQPCRLNLNLPACDGRGLSRSVLARQRFGRQQKRAFYHDPIHGVGFSFPNRDRVFAREMEDLVHAPPSWVKKAIGNKVAHLYLDGNDFTKIREKLIAESDDPLGTEREFSTRLKCLRDAMLREVLDSLNGLDDMTGQLTHPGVFRWETLLWGGDDAAFVMPAWVALAVLRTLAHNFRKSDWRAEENGGLRLTHKIGIHIADRKTPVAVARRIAEALADSAKQGRPGANVAQIMVTESADPPMDVTNIGPDTLARYRARYFGCDDPTVFTLDLDNDLHAFLKGLKRVKAEDGGLPRSQLYGLLRDRTRTPGSDDWRTDVRDAAFTRSGAKCKDVFCKPPFGPGPCGHPLLPFMRVAELLDYHCPETLGESAP